MSLNLKVLFLKMTTVPVTRNHSLDEEELRNHGASRILDLSEHKFGEVSHADWIETSTDKPGLFI